MERMIPIVFVAVAVSVGASAQGGRSAPPPLSLEPGASQADVDKALLAAPAAVRDQATVIKWKSDFTYDTLRKGTNGLVCYDRSGYPLQQPFSVQCTSAANLSREAQNLKAEASGDRSKSEAMLKALEQDGTRAKPAFGSVWVPPVGPRSRSRVPAPDDGRGTRRDGGVARTAREAPGDGRVDYECRHVDRPHHDSRQMSATAPLLLH